MLWRDNWVIPMRNDDSNFEGETLRIVSPLLWVCSKDDLGISICVRKGRIRHTWAWVRLFLACWRLSYHQWLAKSKLSTRSYLEALECRFSLSHFMYLVCVYILYKSSLAVTLHCFERPWIVWAYQLVVIPPSRRHTFSSFIFVSRFPALWFSLLHWVCVVLDSDVTEEYVEPNLKISTLCS